MKLTINEKKALQELLEDPRATNMQLAQKLKITSQAAGKIRRGLINKGVIKDYELILNYDKLGVNCFALTLVKVMPKAFRRYNKEIEEILSCPNIIFSASIPQTNITNVLLFAFRDVSEYTEFFTSMQKNLPGIIEIKDSYVFSKESFTKWSSLDLFKKVVEEFGGKTIPVADLPEVKK